MDTFLIRSVITGQSVKTWNSPQIMFLGNHIHFNKRKTWDCFILSSMFWTSHQEWLTIFLKTNLISFFASKDVSTQWEVQKCSNFISITTLTVLQLPAMMLELLRVLVGCSFPTFTKNFIKCSCKNIQTKQCPTFMEEVFTLKKIHKDL